jgi:hypothetical protein
MDELAAAGYTPWVVEQTIRTKMGCFKRDFLNGIDILAVMPGKILGVQATSDSNLSARVKKLRAEPKMKVWLQAGGELEAWGWRADGRLRKVVIRESDFN